MLNVPSPLPSHSLWGTTPSTKNCKSEFHSPGVTTAPLPNTTVYIAPNERLQRFHTLLIASSASFSHCTPSVNICLCTSAVSSNFISRSKLSNSNRENQSVVQGCCSSQLAPSTMGHGHLQLEFHFAPSIPHMAVTIVNGKCMQSYG